MENNFEIMMDEFAQEDFWMTYGGEDHSFEQEAGEGWEEF